MKSLRLGLSTCFYLLVYLVFPQLAFAACPTGQTETDLGCIPNDPVGFVQKFYGIGVGFISGVSLLVIIYGAYLVLTSSGNPDQLKSGKQAIYYAIGGILMAVFGFVFVELVVRDILKVPGF